MDVEAESPEGIYLSRESGYRDICTEVTYALERNLKANGIKYHSVTSRVKTLESFLEKIERKQYSDPSAQMDDIAGIRVVCLFLSDLDRVSDIVSSLFEVIAKEDKVRQERAEVFGYMSHHYVCRLSAAHAGPRYDHLKDLRFEVQVRTILMDAWANTSHYLSYKNEDSVPQDLLKDFAALSGLLFVADRQFEGLYKASSMSAAHAEREILRSEEVPPSEINADTVHALLLREYPDRQQSSDASVSVFTSELREVGFRDIQSVARILHVIRTIATEAESKNYEHKLPVVAFARMSMVIAHSKSRDLFLKKREKNPDSERVGNAVGKMVKMAEQRGYEEEGMGELP
ncbi:GTP pyrophosphokinase family protein [Streptomyces albogriseolus]|uniref:GTP pyrophosphokinase n=1 Tax=Streptomyces albogriseolus TaxID=1887 RepID=UPI003816E116